MSTSRNDERLAQAAVGQVVPHQDTIELAEYGPQWPTRFEEQETLIRTALGDRALLVEHVGSTSVPGLVAKPTIDIVLTVEDSADEGSFVPQLENVGYSLTAREPDWFEHRLFTRTAPSVNLHVFTDGASEVARMMSFRDHLRAHREHRERYAAVKRELVSCASNSLSMS